MKKEKVFKYLDELRKSGAVNMFGALPYVMRLGFDKQEATSLLSEWMRTFSARQSAGKVAQ